MRCPYQKFYPCGFSALVKGKSEWDSGLRPREVFANEIRRVLDVEKAYERRDGFRFWWLDEESLGCPARNDDDAVRHLLTAFYGPKATYPIETCPAPESVRVDSRIRVVFQF